MVKLAARTATETEPDRAGERNWHWTAMNGVQARKRRS